MKDYQLLHEDDNQFHVSHPDGTHFKVAKKGLSKKVHEQIRGYASGGEIEPDYISSAMTAMRQPASEQSPMMAMDTGYGTRALDQIASTRVPPPIADDVLQKRALYNQVIQPTGPSSEKGFNVDPMGGNVTFGPGGITPTEINPDAWMKAEQLFQNKQQQDAVKYDHMLKGNEARVRLGLQPLDLPTRPLTATTTAQLPTMPVDNSGQIPTVAGAGNVMGDFKHNMGMMEGGLRGMAQAKQTEMNEAAKMWAQYDQSIKAQHEFTQKAVADNQAENDQLYHSLVTAKIDPSRLWNNTSTGNQVMASIGLILGGMGGRGQGNLALETMQKAIDRDVDAQKAELGKKETLYGFNLKKYGNIMAADAATRMQLSTSLQAQLQAAAARSGSATTMQQAQYHIGELRNQYDIPMRMKLGQLAGASALHQPGGYPVNSPLDLHNLSTNPKAGETRVPIGNRVYEGTSKSSADKVRDVETLAGPVVDGIHELSQLGPNALIPGSSANMRANEITSDLAIKLPLMTGATIGAKRINSEEIHHQLNRIKDPTSLRQLFNGEAKNDQFLNSLQGELESVRRNHLTNYQGLSGLKSRTPGFK